MTARVDLRSWWSATRLLAALVVTTPMLAQWAPGSAGSIYTGGPVGIGTMNPGAPLHVQGQDNVDALRISGTNSAKFLVIKPEVSANTTQLLYWNGGGAGNLAFEGNVGIGTLFPAERLHVAGGIVASGGMTNGGSNLIGMSWEPGGGRIIAMGPDGSTAGTLWLVGTNNGGSNAKSWFYGASNGNTGIGTTSPAAKLQVGRSNPSFADPGGLVVGSSTGTGGARQYWIGAANPTNSNNNHFVIGDYGYEGAASFTPFLTILGQHAGANAGNVGIGTTNPTEKLSVNGKILAKEIVVNTGWADHVFRPSYRLRPLTEVAAYIDQNHHLPEIPSEVEVRRNGVGLADMQVKLLTKIEELTLHMIKAEQRNTDLQDEVRVLRLRIDELEHGKAAAPKQ